MTLTFNRSINPEGTLLYCVDATVYTDPARNALGIVALGIFKESSGDKLVHPSAYLGESVSAFTFEVAGKDGVYDIRFWGFPLYNGQILAEGNMVFVAGEQRVKKVIGGALTAIELASLLNESAPHSGSRMAIVPTDLVTRRDDLHLIKLQKQEQLHENCCEFQDFHKAKNNYDYTRSMHVGACIEFKRSNYLNAQLKIERGNEFATKALAQAH
jgi:hypothetical protein